MPRNEGTARPKGFAVCRAGSYPRVYLAATAVTRDGDTLVIELPGISADALRSRRAQLLEIARAVCPELVELRLAPTKGGC